MRKREKEVLAQFLRGEDKTLGALEAAYRQALDEIDERIRLLRADEMTQSKIYQLKYQRALRSQVERIIDKLQGNAYKTVEDYLNGCYRNGFVGTMYALHGQKLPILASIDRNAVEKAVRLDSQLSADLYETMRVDMNKLKQAIRTEISVGISTGKTYDEMAKSVHRRTNVPLSRAKTIVRTEGHRIQQASAADARNEAKRQGCDVLKQWDSTLDANTRPTHRALDGQIRETNEPFEIDGKQADRPGAFRRPEEDCNCRCVALTRARWGLGTDELHTLQERAKFFGMDKTKDFQDFEKKYLKAAEKAVANAEESATIKMGFPESNFKSYSDGNEANNFFYFDDDKRGVLAKRNSQYGKWMNHLENGTRPVIADYCADAYDDINKYWRKIGDWQHIDANRVKYQTNLIDKAIASFNLKDNIQTYRGVNLNTIIQMFPDAGELSDLVGMTFSDKAFSSTSLIRSVAEKFASQNGQDGVLLQLFVPSGVGRGAYINQLSGFQNDEYEFLLKRNAKFEVLAVDTSGEMPVVKGRWLE